MMDSAEKPIQLNGYSPQKIKDPKAIVYVLAGLAAILLLPLMGLYLKEKGIIPADFFNFPATGASPKPMHNKLVAGLVAVVFFIAMLFYVKPGLLGFKKPPVIIQGPIQKVSFPRWGWLGAFLLVTPLIFLWGHFSGPKLLLHWAWIPVFWGYTFLMDAWLYVRSGGKSILKNSPKEMIAIGIAAMGGWMLFEYLNFFVDDNWYYPNGDSIPHEEFLLYAIVGSSGLIPVIFVIYRLLNTFPNIRNKYSHGPAIVLKNWHVNVLLAVFMTGMFLISFFPDQLFGLLWIAPMAILALVLDKIGLWTPFTGLKTGNWSPLLKYTLTYLVYGLSLECLNYFSALHPTGQPLITHTPAVWVYSIPYVNYGYLFEMPLLGYIGYLPFGVYCSVWWISFAYLLNIPSTYLDDEM
jgi:hypothetical protein